MITINVGVLFFLLFFQPDRSYQLVMCHPPSQYLLRMAAGTKKGAATPGQPLLCLTSDHLLIHIRIMHSLNSFRH